MKVFYRFRQKLADIAPSLGRVRRYISALCSSQCQTKRTYAQYGEDRIILDWLNKNSIPKSELYVDIGANHPTDISNTYLLYRNGLMGITIDPNEELMGLHRQFRKHDTTLCIGCSDKNCVLIFNISTTPVRSTFFSKAPGKFVNHIAVPVMCADDILKTIAPGIICFMSIDVEGMNIEVLRGAQDVLKRTRLLCVEYDDLKDIEKYKELLFPMYHELARTHCNIIFKNIEMKN